MFKSIARIFHHRSQEDALHLIPKFPSKPPSGLHSYSRYVQQDVVFTGVGPVDPPARRNHTPRHQPPSRSNDITYTGAGLQYRDVTLTGAGAGTLYTDITYAGAKSPSASPYRDVAFTGAGLSPFAVLLRPSASRRRPYRDIVDTGASSYMSPSGNSL
ncbi:hypothetical protein BOTBODRAFT_40299 [Botryobasidium botryosum FD-172 SS1]|uniref:Uncharacterized protein n=1 Tax=Botryobasidium botryosum (strain FD-172 SS1) TaxID=930990 RepID=A0A067N114_BOTB1|nr:hypothetical protein BOTBODRAFT_40299 [Botryobasidium botryosum FD-172 SS1]